MLPKSIVSFFPLIRPGVFITLAIGAISAHAATLSVGPGKMYATPCAALTLAASGDIVEITGGVTYAGDVCSFGANNLTIRGVNGRPRINAAGANASGKAIWVVTGNNVTVENVEMFGAAVPDRNGAAFRLEGNNFTLRTSYLHDNENGILVGPVTDSNILIEYSEFAHNGNGAGSTHNLYIGDIASLTFRYNYSHDANVGHNLKSRAAVNTILYNRFSSTPPGSAGGTASGQPSYEINLPNGGTAYIIGNVIQQPAVNQNPALISYGEEGLTKPTQDLYVVNNTFINENATSATFVQVGNDITVPVLTQNNIFSGVGNLSNRSDVIDRNNYRSVAAGFVDAANYDLHPTANNLVINAGTNPGVARSGFSLTPVSQYKHVAGGEARVITGAIDIGAYEAISTTTTPPPAPAWVACGQEGSVCKLTGPAQVRFGAGSSFVVKTAKSSVACSSTVFGDPAPGLAKSCSYTPVTH